MSASERKSCERPASREPKTVLKSPDAAATPSAAISSAPAVTTSFDAATTVYGDVIGSAASFVHSAWGTAINGLSPDSPLAISDASFRNYAGGNFMPAAGSALAKGGTSWSDYLGSGALSETDLVGRARRIGRVLDIGCYKAPDTNLSIILR